MLGIACVNLYLVLLLRLFMFVGSISPSIFQDTAEIICFFFFHLNTSCSRFGE